MGRRGRNEGSIYRRADGLWAAAASAGTFKGKRRRRVVYGRSRQDVQNRLREIQRAMEDGFAAVSPRDTLGMFLERWLRESVQPGVRPATALSYTGRIRLHIVPELGHIRLARLAPLDVQAYLNRKLSSGLSPRTVQYHHAILRRALGQALRWGRVPKCREARRCAPRTPE
jgi:integrase